jgi:hypothetical protein
MHSEPALSTRHQGGNTVPTPVDVDPVRTYHDIYARLVDLCERDTELREDAHICVMEAFTTLTEGDLHLPTQLPDVHYGPVRDVLRQIRGLLTGLISNSSDLETALALIRVDACIDAALAEHR